jgi:hypothetical protein
MRLPMPGLSSKCVLAWRRFFEELAGLPAAGVAYCHAQFRIAAEATAVALAMDAMDAALLSIESNPTQFVVAATCRVGLIGAFLDPVRLVPRVVLAAIHDPAIGRNLSPYGGEANSSRRLLSDILRTPPTPAALDRAKEASVRDHLAKDAA